MMVAKYLSTGGWPPSGAASAWNFWIVAAVRRMPAGDAAASLAAASTLPAASSVLNCATYSSSAPPSPRRDASAMARLVFLSWLDTYGTSAPSLSVSSSTCPVRAVMASTPPDASCTDAVKTGVSAILWRKITAPVGTSYTYAKPALVRMKSTSCFLDACMATGKSPAAVASGGTGRSCGARRKTPPGALRSLPTSMIMSLGPAPGFWSTNANKMAVSLRPGSLHAWKQPACDVSGCETFFSTEYSCMAPSTPPPAAPGLMPTVMSHWPSGDTA